MKNLDQTVQEVKGILSSLLLNEVNSLKKGLGEEDDTDGPGAADGGGAPPASEGAAETPGASDAPPGTAPGEESGAEQGAPGGAPGDDAPPSMEELVQQYSQLPPEELKMHLEAATQAYQAAAGAAGAGGPPQGQGQASPPPQGGPEMAAMKSEIANLKAVCIDLKKSLEDSRKPTPRVGQKAVTGANAAARLGTAAAPAKPLNKAELHAKLVALCRDPDQSKLSKHERDLINDYYNRGQQNPALLQTITGLAGLFVK